MSYNRLFEFAKISFSQKLLDDLVSIATWQERLQSVDTTNISPLYNVLDDIKNCGVRNDEKSEIICTPLDILSNASVVENNYIVVPSVINSDE